MNKFSRPVEESLFERKEKADQVCPECGSSQVAAYGVLTDGGWWDVVKCQDCLYSIDRKRCKNQYTPCTLLWDLM